MNDISNQNETKVDGKQVITACAFIHHAFDGVEKIFLPKRALTKKFLPGMFELPGGHIEFGEDIVEGLQREIREELSVKVSIGDPFSVFTYMNHSKGSHSVEVTYFAKFSDPLERIRINSEDHSEYKWVAENELIEVSEISDEELKSIKKGFDLLKGGQQLLG